jgi:hypothetical protein
MQFTEFKTASQIKLHKANCKICNLPETLRNDVDALLVADCADSEVVRLCAKHAISISPSNVCNHRRYLPYLVDEEVLARASEKANAIVCGNTAEGITKMEKLIMETRQKVAEGQERLKDQLWNGAIPALVDAISKQAVEGMPQLGDVARALDVIMKNAMLLGGNATQRVEVKTTDGDPRGQGITPLTSSVQATIEAINRANETLPGGSSERGEG